MKYEGKILKRKIILSDMIKNIILWLVIAVILMSVFSSFNPRYSQPIKISYSQFIDKMKNGDIKQITVDEKSVEGLTASDETFVTEVPAVPDLYTIDEVWVEKYGVSVKAKPPEQQSMLMHIFISWFPIILFIGVWIFFMRQMQGGGSGRGAMSFGRSKARLLGEDQIKVTFEDVAGVEEAKQEVAELVDFLKDPAKYHQLGGKIPSGVLMVGAPGTGKTLLAKAIAGEAKVPFFSISGSDFVEMFVGVGASRVRDMFDQAKKHAPCIIFIDEIDAVGRHRGAGLGGGHDEREQTLNQLLVEMDGFEGNEGVIVIAATNRPDVLDPALLRPGRFDRQVTVPLPDVLGREHILKVHMKKLPCAKDVKPKYLARGTPGFSGADLENLVNEAALLAARANKRIVDMNLFEQAKDKLIMGVERRSMVMGEDEKKLTAYHEAGHAMVGWLLKDQEMHDPVYKVSIIPRGRALGVTMFLPEKDRYSLSKAQLQAQICSLFGGRIAEELIFGEDKVTTGASNDIERATDICRKMVTKWGLSGLGPLTFGEDEGEVFLGHSVARRKDVSDDTAKAIDHEIKKIVDINYNKAREMIKNNLDKLHALAKALIKYETIDLIQIKDIMEGREVRPPKDWKEDLNDDENNKKGEKASKEEEDDEIGKILKPNDKPANFDDEDQIEET